ncbi:hypothetical protein EC968_003565 [Mortierella alpina]|nr:hypothetical protein EC968_003565 [Mortierella alpina]
MFFSSHSLSLLSIFVLLAVPALGQTDPIPVTAPASARWGNTLYLAGGAYSSKLEFQNSYNQFISLDLSVPWDAANPSWKGLSSGPRQRMFSAVMSGDGKTMATFRTGEPAFSWLYDVAKDLWRSSQIVVPNPTLEGIYGVTDPTSNLVYLAGGFPQNDSVLTDMLVYHFDSDSLTQLAMPPQGLVNRRYYKGVWWARSQSIIYFGGYEYGTGTGVPGGFIQYTPRTNTWATLITKGTAPSGRADFCMEIADDGSKLVVFGGRAFAGTTFTTNGDLFVLDLSTLTWIQGPTYASPRTYPACTIVGSTFIAWGGQDNVATVTKAAILYDLGTNQYITRFTPIVPPGPTASTTPDSKEGTSNTGAIIGGVAGSIAVIALAGGIFFCMRRKNRRKAASRDHLSLTTLDSPHQYEAKVDRRGDNGDGAISIPLTESALSTGPIYATDTVSAGYVSPPPSKPGSGPQQYAYRTVQTHNALKDYQDEMQGSGNYRDPQYIPNAYVEEGGHNTRRGPHN